MDAEEVEAPTPKMLAFEAGVPVACVEPPNAALLVGAGAGVEVVAKGLGVVRAPNPLDGVGAGAIEKGFATIPPTGAAADATAPEMEGVGELKVVLPPPKRPADAGLLGMLASPVEVEPNVVDVRLLVSGVFTVLPNPPNPGVAGAVPALGTLNPEAGFETPGWEKLNAPGLGAPAFGSLVPVPEPLPPNEKDMDARYEVTSSPIMMCS